MTAGDAGSREEPHQLLGPRQWIHSAPLAAFLLLWDWGWGVSPPEWGPQEEGFDVHSWLEPWATSHHQAASSQPWEACSWLAEVCVSSHRPWDPAETGVGCKDGQLGVNSTGERGQREAGARRQ